MRKGNKNNKVPEEKNKGKVRDLIGENRRLRKEVQTLRKELGRMTNRDLELQELMDEVVSEVQTEIDTSNAFCCPNCNSSEARLMDIRGPGSHWNCPSCGKTGATKK